jgi:hypothetical protein
MERPGATKKAPDFRGLYRFSNRKCGFFIILACKNAEKSAYLSGDGGGGWAAPVAPEVEKMMVKIIVFVLQVLEAVAELLN